MHIRSVMVVDDDASIRAVAQIALHEVGGLLVYTVSSGAEALVRAAELQPSVILLDVVMPFPDGVATLASLQTSPATARIPVIFLTACASASEEARLLALGARAVIAKPFDPMTLSRKVVSAMQEV